MFAVFQKTLYGIRLTGRTKETRQANPATMTYITARPESLSEKGTAKKDKKVLFCDKTKVPLHDTNRWQAI